MFQTLARHPLALDEVLLVNAKLAACYAQRANLRAALTTLDERIADLEAALDACHELTPFEAALAGAEADAREGRR